jgi:ATP-dependent DNA ligase
MGRLALRHAGRPGRHDDADQPVGQRLTRNYPELVDGVLRDVLRGQAAFLDGELVAADEATGRPDFGRLQTTNARPPRVCRRAPS